MSKKPLSGSTECRWHSNSRSLATPATDQHNMAQPKPITRTIARIVERSDNPVYFVNLDHQIVFANQATAQWAGLTVDELRAAPISQSGDFENDSVARRRQGLAPPAELLADEPANNRASQQSFQIWKTVTEAGSQQSPTTLFCSAFARLIYENGVPTGVLVFAEPTTAATDAVAAPADGSTLRTILAKSRNQLGQFFSLESLVGESPFAYRVRQQVILARQAKTSVLITGPAGSGKEHLGRVLFDACYDDEGPALTPVHCSIADPKLIQQAISDAKEFDHRHRSAEIVLLLMDVDQLSPSAQQELVGFLKQPGFPVRTFATAQESLLDLAAQQTFLPSLAFQLSPLVIPLVPLVDRRQDIPVLAQALLESNNQKRQRKRSKFSDKAIEALVEFDWPANLSQLRSVVEAASDHCEGSVVTENDLPEQFHQAVSAMRIGKPVVDAIDLETYLASIEKQLVVRAIQQAKGNKTQAAKQLNISRPKLLRRLQLFELDEFLSPQASDDQLDSSAFEELPE